MKYVKCCALFLANSEIISLLALLIMTGMFLWDLACARFVGTPSNARRYGEEGW